MAAHIHAASPGGPRYRSEQTPEDRSAAQNGIWLCQSCAKLIDSDPERFTARQLNEWKNAAEEWALVQIRATDAERDLVVRSPVAAVPLTNQATPALACLEHLRLENIQAPWDEIPSLFSSARVMTDGAGDRIGWDVVELCSSDSLTIQQVLDRFAEEGPSVAKRYELAHHFLAVVACGATTARNEEVAGMVEEMCARSRGQRGIQVLIGFMANIRFVDRCLTGA